MESIRFSGLASGMDTQSIVEQLMRAERMPLDRLGQKKQTLEWQRDDYREMNKLLQEFDDFIFDGIYRQSNMLKRTATSSNEAAVSATASANAGNISYTIENVTLASAARRISTAGISNDPANKIDPNKSLWSQKDKFATTTGWDWQQEKKSQDFTAPEGGGKALNLEKGAISQLYAADGTTTIGIGDSIVVTASDGTTDTNYEIVATEAELTTTANSVYIDQNTGKVTFSETITEGSTFTIGYDTNYLEMNVQTYDENGSAQDLNENLKFDGTQSLNQMLSAINKADAGINMFYDSTSDKVVTSRDKTGDFTSTDDEITFTGPSSAFFTDVLNLGTETDGSNTSYTINGLTTSSKSNTFTMNDVTFTLKKNTDPGEQITINTQTDTDAIMDTVKSFVEKYNEMIEKINGKLTEERFRSFNPLTDEQKTAMSDKEIEDWEEKARSGLLKRDFILSSGLSNMRMDMYTEVDFGIESTPDNPVKYNQLSEIGIKTSKNYLEHGKLEIDEAKLRAAIEDDPDAVYKLFMQDGDKYSEKGIARRLRDSVSNTIEKVEAKAGNKFRTNSNFAIGKQLDRVDDEIDSFEKRLKQIEERYWNQFNAMESAMQRMNAQSAQLMSQLGMPQQ